jgi:hypothetical protein
MSIASGTELFKKIVVAQREVRKELEMDNQVSGKAMALYTYNFVG